MAKMQPPGAAKLTQYTTKRISEKSYVKTGLGKLED